MQSTSWGTLGWMKHKLESRLPGEISITSDTQMIPPLWQKEPLDERAEWKSWLKTQHSENWDHGVWSHHFMANRWGHNGNRDRLYFGGAPKSLQMETAAMKLKNALKVMTNLDSILKSRDITLPTKICLVKAMVFLVVIYGCELDYEGSWVLENWFFWTVVLEIQPVHPKKSVLNIRWKDWC